MDFWARLDKEISRVSSRKAVTSNAQIAPNSISLWIKRETYPPANVLAKIAADLGTSVEYLLYGSNTPASLASAIAARPALRSLVERLVAASDEDIIKVSGILDIVKPGSPAKSAEAAETRSAEG